MYTIRMEGNIIPVSDLEKIRTIAEKKRRASIEVKVVREMPGGEMSERVIGIFVLSGMSIKDIERKIREALLPTGYDPVC